MSSFLVFEEQAQKLCQKDSSRWPMTEDEKSFWYQFCTTKYHPERWRKMECDVDPVDLEPIPENKLIRLQIFYQGQETPKLQCYNLEGLMRLVYTAEKEKKKALEPITGIPFTEYQIALIKDKYRERGLSLQEFERERIAGEKARELEKKKELEAEQEKEIAAAYLPREQQELMLQLEERKRVEREQKRKELERKRIEQEKKEQAELPAILIKRMKISLREFKASLGDIADDVYNCKYVRDHILKPIVLAQREWTARVERKFVDSTGNPRAPTLEESRKFSRAAAFDEKLEWGNLHKSFSLTFKKFLEDCATYFHREAEELRGGIVQK